MSNISKLYDCAKEIYAERGIDTEAAMARVAEMPLSLHAWQGDDVVGFESTGHALTGGCQVTGNYPGRARTSDELRKRLGVKPSDGTVHIFGTSASDEGKMLIVSVISK